VVTVARIDINEALPLRQAVLWPHSPINACRVDGDEHAHHYGAYCEQQLIGVGSLFINQRHARLRKFAVDPQYQHQGVGTNLLTTMINRLHEQHINILWCDARVSAIDFYRRRGFTQTSDTFLKRGVRYCKMSYQIHE